MNRYIGFFLVCFFTATNATAQVDTLSDKGPLLIFDQLTKELKEYKLDTAGVPNDKITKVIIELRNLRGGFNINEALDYKLQEDKQKKEVSDAAFESFSLFFKTGNGKKWLDNAVIWIYRQHFTYSELKQLVKFYKTPAGQKIANEFPVIMIKSLAAAEGIKNIYMQGQTIRK